MVQGRGKPFSVAPLPKGRGRRDQVGWTPRLQTPPICRNPTKPRPFGQTAANLPNSHTNRFWTSQMPRKLLCGSLPKPAPGCRDGWGFDICLGFGCGQPRPAGFVLPASSGAELRGVEFFLNSRRPTCPDFRAASAAILPDGGAVTAHVDSPWVELSTTPTDAPPTSTRAELGSANFERPPRPRTTPPAAPTGCAGSERV